MAVLFIIAVMASAIAMIFSITTTEGRFMRRSVGRTTAVAYGDGVIQCLFDQWRLALSNTVDPTQHASGFTYNELMNGTATSPSTSVPSPLPLKAPTAAQLPVASPGITLTSWSVRPATPYLATISDNATHSQRRKSGTQLPAAPPDELHRHRARSASRAAA